MDHDSTTNHLTCDCCEQTGPDVEASTFRSWGEWITVNQCAAGTGCLTEDWLDRPVLAAYDRNHELSACH